MRIVADALLLPFFFLRCFGSNFFKKINIGDHPSVRNISAFWRVKASSEGTRAPSRPLPPPPFRRSGVGPQVADLQQREHALRQQDLQVCRFVDGNSWR